MGKTTLHQKVCVGSRRNSKRLLSPQREHADTGITDITETTSGH